MSEHKRKAIRAFFLFSVIALTVQSGVILLVGEPWPAITLPAFGDVPDNGDGIEQWETTFSVVFADSSMGETSRAELFSMVPNAFHSSILHGNYRSKSTMSGYARRSFPEHRESGQQPEAVAWLGNRLATLYPGRKPVYMNVVWARETYQIREKQMVSTNRSVVDTLTITFE